MAPADTLLAVTNSRWAGRSAEASPRAGSIWKNSSLLGYQGRDRVDFRAFCLAQPLQVILGLQGEPEFRAISAELAQAQRHLGGNRRALGQDRMQGLARDAQLARNVRRRK
jgi:hypothetical protein